MRFTLYTEKTVSQCMKALNERMEAKPTKTRLALDGEVPKKGGKFALAVTSKVAALFNRKTRLKGTVRRESGMTIIEGYVSHGVPRERARWIVLAMVAVGVMMLATGNGLPGLLATAFGLGLYIPLVGDHHNSAYLIKELKRATKAKDKPPKG